MGVLIAISGVEMGDINMHSSTNQLILMRQLEYLIRMNVFKPKMCFKDNQEIRQWLEKYIVCNVCGLRSPSIESSGVLYISPTHTSSMQELIMQGLQQK